ncbi:MAG: hypothetical protein KDA81_05930 [Planctomycetaceae bacterium]|nr:hypothetical protein [Planctomycetaceae bacterium]
MKKFMVCFSVLVLTASSVVPADEKSEKTAEAVAIAAPPAAKGSEAPKAPAVTVRPLAVTVELTSGTKLQGTLMETSELPMRTAFGQATIPLAEVAGIKLASEGNATTTVVMHNGDSITGATELNRLLVETEWGKADITGSSISAVLFAQGLQWTSSAGLNGTRWTLTEAQKPQAPPTPAQPATRTGVTNAGGTVVPSNVRPVSGFRTIGQ